VIASKIEVIKNAGGEMQSRRYRHDVRGFLSGSSQSDITLAMNGLISALAVPYQNFIFYQDDGSPSATTLMNGPSLSGVTVVEGPNFVESTGAEYATQREFTFAVEAEYALSGTVGLLLMFHEQLDFKGGGPRFVHREAVVGPSQKQRVREQTTYFVTQSGEAVGYKSVPSIPPPIWPDSLVDAPDTMIRSPMKKGKGFEGYPVSWMYRFASSTPLSGVPHAWE